MVLFWTQNDFDISQSWDANSTLPCNERPFFVNYSDLPYVNFNKLDFDEQNMILNVTKDFPLPYAKFMFGYMMPVLLLITLITNSLVVMVLTKPHMSSPTNTVLYTMAIVDMLTMLSASPWYFYIYSLGYYEWFLYPAIACYLHQLMTDVIPIYFHTASIWLALLLAGQRYIYVCHPSLAMNWCTVPKVRRAICCIFFIAFVHQCGRLFDLEYQSIILLYNDKCVRACRYQYAGWVRRIEITYYITYFSFRIVFVLIGPCIALISLNCMLFKALERVETKRFQLFQTKFDGATMTEATLVPAANIGSKYRSSLEHQQLVESKQMQDTKNDEIIGSTSRLLASVNRESTGQILLSDSEILTTTTTVNNKCCVNYNDDSLVISCFDNSRNNKTKQRTSIEDSDTKTSCCAAPENRDIECTSDNSMVQQITTSEIIEHQIDSNSEHNNKSIQKTKHRQPAKVSVNTCGRASQSGTLFFKNQVNQALHPQTSRSMDSNRTTSMLIVVVTLFLIVEIPVAITTAVHVILNTLEMFKHVDYTTLNYIKMFTNFHIMLSYPVNFTIYCSMSKRFRDTFRQLFMKKGKILTKRKSKSDNNTTNGNAKDMIGIQPTEGVLEQRNMASKRAKINQQNQECEL